MADASDPAQESPTVYTIRQSVATPQECDVCGCAEYIHSDITYETLDDDDDVRAIWVPGRLFSCGRAHTVDYGWLKFCELEIETPKTPEPITECDVCGSPNMIHSFGEEDSVHFKCGRAFTHRSPSSYCNAPPPPPPPPTPPRPVTPHYRDLPINQPYKPRSNKFVASLTLVLLAFSVWAIQPEQTRTSWISKITTIMR